MLLHAGRASAPPPPLQRWLARVALPTATVNALFRWPCFPVSKVVTRLTVSSHSSDLSAAFHNAHSSYHTPAITLTLHITHQSLHSLFISHTSHYTHSSYHTPVTLSNALQAKALRAWGASTFPTGVLQLIVSLHERKAGADLMLTPAELETTTVADAKRKLFELAGATEAVDKYVLRLAGYHEYFLFDDLLLIQHRNVLQDLISFRRVRVVAVRVDEGQCSDIALVREHLSRDVSERLQAVMRVPQDSAPTASPGPGDQHTTALQVMRNETGADAVTRALEQGKLQPWQTVTPVDAKRRHVLFLVPVV